MRPNPFERKPKQKEAHYPMSPEIAADSELLPYCKEMNDWLEGHLDDLAFFLEYGPSLPKFEYGSGFAFNPEKNTIILDAPGFRRSREAGMSVEQAMVFFVLHEAAHVKTMLELDAAGRYNQLEQFKYEGKKAIRDKKDPARFANLRPTYRMFSNITEDAIVNFLVLNTLHFSERTSAKGKRAREGVRELYTDKAFQMFRKTDEGQGDHIANPDPATVAKTPFLHVGEGKGNLQLLRTSDYEQGFDFNTVLPELERSAQFLTFFIKREMSVVSEKDIYDEDENPQGKFRLHEDAAAVLTRPLTEALEDLLKKVQAKYQDDPEQMQRYAEFLKMANRIANYKEVDGKIEEDKPDVVENVMGEKCIDENFRLNVALAKRQFRKRIEDALALMDEDPDRATEITYLNFFDLFKKFGKAKKPSFTIPLARGLRDRSRFTRNCLEPLFTLLCVLDDSFDIELPPDKPAPPRGSPPEGPPPPPKKWEWERGENVKNVKSDSPNHGKKGIITGINYDESGEVMSIEVEYYE